MKILLVSDTTHFALTDVYYGYKSAMETLGVSHECFPFHSALELVSVQTCFHMMHSRALLKDSGITHVMFIGGLSIPDSILESFHHVKTIVVATEDPHTFDPMKNRLDKIDYYFSNERSIPSSGRWGNAFYCPTAANPSVCGVIPKSTLDPKYLSDIVFLGAMYPNRREMLEGILPQVRQNGWNLKILGHPSFLPRESPLWEYVPPENYDSKGNIRTIPHQETIRYYCGARIVLNFFRDITWNPKTSNKLNPHNSDNFAAESLNPRAYEASLCGTLQLLEDSRAESREVFTEEEVGFFSDAESLAESIQFFLREENEDLKRGMESKAFMKVSTQHTYVNRMQHILYVLAK